MPGAAIGAGPGLGVPAILPIALLVRVGVRARHAVPRRHPSAPTLASGHLADACGTSCVQAPF
eukprot:12239532-Alexandrium_andersonii.AAC.1